MVQAIENRAEIRGRVEEVESGGADGKLIIRLRLDEIRSVPGYANLLGEAETMSEIVFGAQEVPDSIAAGDVLTCQVKLVGPGRYVALPGSCRTQS